MTSLPTKGATAPTSLAQPRARSYKEYLTPALHRSFSNAALAVLVVCWLEAILFARFSLFWSWFPLGINGIRTSLLFICSLIVFLLRLTNLHLGQRTYTTAFQAFWRTTLSTTTLFAFLWYYMSAFLFSEVYIFSTSDTSDLNWIDTGKSYERARLNERAVIFRSLYLMLALVQAGAHLYFDYDALLLPYSNRSTNGKDLTLPHSLSQLPPLHQLRAFATYLAIHTSAIVGSVTVLGPIIYFTCLRQYAWEISYNMAGTVYTLARSPRPPGLTGVWALLGRSLWSSILLVLLWQLTNLAFTIYGSQEPLKKDRPLTDDSRDPNGSLANGLKVRKALPHSIALWELQIIAERFETRRRSIYNDYEKPTSTSWADIVQACSAEIERISSSIQRSQAPSPAPQSASSNAPAPLPPRQHIARPLKENQQILSAPPRAGSALDALADGVGTVAKSWGQSHGSSSPVVQRTQALIAQSAASAEYTTERASGYIISFLRTPLGAPFRATFRRRVNAIIFGTPFSRAADTHHAIQAISKLIACSLIEDNFGQVQKDIARVLQVLVKAMQDINNLVATLQPHWSDVYHQKGARVPEVEELLVTLKAGIELIVITFGEYAAALGISPAELRVAKDLVGKDSEMVKK